MARHGDGAPSATKDRCRPGLRERVAELSALRSRAHGGPRPRATEAQQAKGRHAARGRLELHLRRGTSTEARGPRHRATGFGLKTNRPHTDGVLIGWGQVEGRRIFASPHGLRVLGAALSDGHTGKIHTLMYLAGTRKGRGGGGGAPAPPPPAPRGGGPGGGPGGGGGGRPQGVG
ncbi:carboxyl transferase domain-containing protein, partial [Streptomyces sp. NPDC006856]|uniref:carboxyl transferase domain-containing protein n=1 Tax=Streptomyces sp. NPDC006856 TaxID=3364766 RepID=UPI0036933CB4